MPRSDWKRIVFLRAHARATEVQRKQRYVDGGRMQFIVSSEFMRRLVEAAELRGLTPTVYCRRAVAAFISADLGIPFADMTAQGAHPRGPGHGTFDPGTGFGPWVATGFPRDNDGDLAS